MHKILFRMSLFLIMHSIVILVTASGQSNVAHVVFEEPGRYVIHDKILHQVVRARVTDALQMPVPFIPVHFSSSDPEIADFMFSTTVTDSSGLAATVIQSQVSADTIVFPPEEFRSRFPLITATAGMVRSNEVRVDIWWGAIVELWIMGPYFKEHFESFSDTAALMGDTLTLQGEIFEVWDLIPPADMFRTYNTDSRIARADSAIVDSNIVMVTIRCLKEGMAHIIVDGHPPAVIGIRVDFSSEVLDESQSLYVPTVFTLEQNYPNPFNPETTIEYQLPSPSEVTIKIYNLRGQLVKTLVDQKLAQGHYSVNWNGMDDAGRDVASGVYFYRLRAKDYVQTRKMALVR